MASGTGQPLPAWRISPVYADGHLLIDGGALDDVPVEIIRARVGSGCVIAADLSPEVEPMPTAPFGPGLSGWRVLWHRINPVGTPWPVPNMVDIISRSTRLAQVRRRRPALAGDNIDLLLRPSIAGLGALDFKGGLPLMEVGYRHAAEQLEKSGLPDRFTS